MEPHDFRYRQFLPTIILQCMRWYLRYPLSYCNLEEMMAQRGADVDHTTLFRWHARTFCRSWHLDETYLRVKGKWKYLYRASDHRRIKRRTRPMLGFKSLISARRVIKGIKGPGFSTLVLYVIKSHLGPIFKLIRVFNYSF